MKKSIILVAIALLVVAGLAASYFVFINKLINKGPTSRELYRQALDESVSLGTKEPYVSFDIDSTSMNLKGEFKGDISGDTGQLMGEMNINASSEGIPLSMTVEIIAIKENGKSQEYVRFTSVTSSSSRYRSAIQEYFAPALNKWVRSDEKNKVDKPASFEEDGALAAFNPIDIFIPMTSLSEDDKRIFLSAVDKYDLYEVGETVQKTQFRGVEARKITVTVNKDAFLNFDKEVSEALSKDSGYDKFEAKFIDQLFGKSNKFSADIYLDPDTATIIGVNLNVDLDSPVKETDFDTTIDKITASALIDYDRDLVVNAPESSITEQQLDALMPQ